LLTAGRWLPIAPKGKSRPLWPHRRGVDHGPIAIDTNVLVAGLRSGGGASRAVLRRALGGRLQPLFGNALWMEYQDLLGRPVWGGATTADERHKSLAQSRGLSMNKLVEQLSAHALSAWDTENHFRAMAATGDVPTALAVLDRLDATDTQP